MGSAIPPFKLNFPPHLNTNNSLKYFAKNLKPILCSNSTNKIR